MDKADATSQKESLRDAVFHFNRLAKHLNDVLKVNLRTPQALDELENALQKVPSGSTFGEALEEARTSLKDSIVTLRNERAQKFGRLEADFVRAARERGSPVREQNEGWRIGRLEFQFRREQAMARALYNREEIVGWKPIDDISDLEQVESAALKTLSTAEFPL